MEYIKYVYGGAPELSAVRIYSMPYGASKKNLQ